VLPSLALCCQGHAEAQCNLGVCYQDGDGVEQNLARAVELYQQAAEQGEAGAQYNLGVIYHSGSGVEKSLETAVQWWTKAAAQVSMSPYTVSSCSCPCVLCG